MYKGEGRGRGRFGEQGEEKGEGETKRRRRQLSANSIALSVEILSLISLNLLINKKTTTTSILNRNIGFQNERKFSEVSLQLKSLKSQGKSKPCFVNWP